MTACALLLLAFAANAQLADSGHKLDYLKGPATAHLGSVANLLLPRGYIFLDAEHTRAYLQARGEPVGGHEAGFLTTVAQNWSVLFIYDAGGYVSDDEKDKLDPNRLLESIRQAAVAGNQERQRRGTPTVEVLGWELPPQYDPAAHSLDWAVRGVSQGRAVVNYNARLLGRRGVMQAILIVAPDKLRGTLPLFRNVLAGFSFLPGQKYTDYRPGDTVAPAGLSALVVGSPAGASAATPLTWAVALLALVGVAFALFRRLRRRPAPRRKR